MEDGVHVQSCSKCLPIVQASFLMVHVKFSFRKKNTVSGLKVLKFSTVVNALMIVRKGSACVRYLKSN